VLCCGSNPIDDDHDTVLRMLSDYVGERAFLKGVSIYLKKHLYGNTVSKDLWDGISEAVGHDVGEMMTTWVGKVCHLVRPRLAC
jgi:aminopeptidase 2